MAWFQVDDQLAMHRKVCEAGNAAMGLWVRAGAWSMANLTEGFVSRSAAKTLGTASQAKALVTAGLWVETETGYQFHEWGTRQMSADQIAERRRKRAEAGTKGGQRSGESRRANKPEAKQEAKPEASASAKPEQKRTPVPVPVLSVVTLGGNVTRVDARDPDDQPPPHCSRHMPDGTSEPCAACGHAKAARREWDSQQRLAAVEERRAFMVEQAELRQAAIDRCQICDPQGYVGGRVCDHVDRRHQPGREAVMAALKAKAGDA